MYIDKLVEINKSELIEIDGNYKYIITAYDDITEINYLEKDENKVFKSIQKFNIPSCQDIQICEKIIELRKAFKE